MPVFVMLVAKRTDKGLDLVAFLCQKYDTSEDELKVMLEKVNSLIVDILKREPRSASECKAENLHNIDTGEIIISLFPVMESFPTQDCLLFTKLSIGLFP